MTQIDIKNHLQRAESIAKLLDNQFMIGRFGVGLDPILGLIPGAGDTVALAISAYLIWIAAQMNVPKSVLMVMLFYALLDFVIGMVPVVGDILDFFYKPNQMNLAIIKKHYHALSPA